MLVEHALERDSQRTEYYAQTKSAFSQTAHIVSKQKWIVRFLLCRNGTVFHFSSFFCASLDTGSPGGTYDLNSSSSARKANCVM